MLVEEPSTPLPNERMKEEESNGTMQNELKIASTFTLHTNAMIKDEESVALVTESWKEDVCKKAKREIGEPKIVLIKVLPKVKQVLS